MVVSYATSDDTVPAIVTFWEEGGSAPPRTANGTRDAYSQLMYIAHELTDPAMDEPLSDAAVMGLQNTSWWAGSLPFFPYGRGASYKVPARPRMGLGDYKNPSMIYNSPVICTVTLDSLEPRRTYNYRVAGSSETYSFTMPPASDEPALYPWTLGMTADLGQTEISRVNVDVLAAALEGSAGVVLLAGDLSYADGYYPRWDSYGRMVEPLAARIPIMTTGGNHELGTAEAWVSYKVRYPMPSEPSGSVSQLWWSRDIGPAHVVSLCSYAGTHEGSLQHRWLLRDLASVDRAATPWLIVMMHVPWYNSNRGHQGEGELMRRDMESSLYAAGVDVVLSGHVHAYERTHPTYDGCYDPCGPVYLNLGDGGNREGAYVPWLEPQPEWSAFREGTFGVGLLTFTNETHLWYNWTRAACASLDESQGNMNFASGCYTRTKFAEDNSATRTQDSEGLWIVRPADRSTQCTPTQCSPTPVPPPPPAAREDAAAPTSDTAAVATGAAFIGFALGALAMWLFGVARARQRSRSRPYVREVDLKAVLETGAAAPSVGSAAHGATTPPIAGVAHA